MITVEYKHSQGSMENSSPTMPEVSENDPHGQTKRPPKDDYTNEGEFQKFSVLLDRIEAMHKIFKRRRVNCSPREDMPSLEKKFTESKSSWKPSFIWEDFLSNRQNLQCPMNDNGSCSKIIQKQEISSLNNVVVGSSVKHVYIDLNADPTIE
ncbi:hypothetical protein SUGI_0465680 [Cryptomeria japonica]|nr:hypothetical protein SUGI_0465680 [Cryptomeria japonica]